MEARPSLADSAEQGASSGVSISLCVRLEEITFGSEHERRGKKKRPTRDVRVRTISAFCSPAAAPSSKSYSLGAYLSWD